MCNASFSPYSDEARPTSPPPSSSPENNHFTRFRKPTLRSLAAPSGATVRSTEKQRPASLFLGADSRGTDDEEPVAHFLDSCSLCGAPLRAGEDIYMYRGDTPFCSEECRQLQIDVDEAKEKEEARKKNRAKISGRKMAGDLDGRCFDQICVRTAGTVVAGCR